MSSYRAHIFKRRNVGEREEVQIKLFGSDGEPLDLTPAEVEIPEGGSQQLTVYHAAEQNFAGITAPTSSTPADKLNFELEEFRIVQLFVQFNAWAVNDLLSSLYIDGNLALNENDGNIWKNNGAGSAVAIYLTYNGYSQFIQSVGASVAPNMVAGTGVPFWLPAGEHEFEMKYNSSSGAAARISERRMAIIY